MDKMVTGRKKTKNRAVSKSPEQSPLSFPHFDDLPATTITSVIYSNLMIDGKKLFSRLPLSSQADHSVVLRSKQERKDFCKNIDENQIISIQQVDQIRGCVIRKSKKYWCNVCQLFEKVGDPPMPEKVNTVSETYVYDREKNITKVLCYCSNCHKTYTPSELKILAYFRNQVMVYMATSRNLVNLMIFTSSGKIAIMKMAGSSTVKESRQIIADFWRHKIYPTGSWRFFSSKPEDQTVRFIFEEGMINFNFNFGTFVDPEKFYLIWQEEKGKGDVVNVTPGSSGQKCINIKFRKMAQTGRILLSFPSPSSNKATLTSVETWPEDIVHVKKKKKSEKLPTIVVFMTTSTLVTGKDYEELKHWYYYFRDRVLKYEQEIKEEIRSLDLKAIDKILATPLV